MNKKFDFFQALPIVNLFLAIMILFHHVFNMNVDFDQAPVGEGIALNLTYVIERYLYNLSECAVPIFFFISAILFYRNYDGTLTTYTAKVKNRLYSLGVPYLIFNILGYFKYIIFSHEQFNFFSFLKSILLSETVPLWFVRELFFFVLFSPIIFKLQKRKEWGLWLSILLISGVAIGLVPYRSFLYWFPIYFLGSLCKVEKVQQMVCFAERNKFISVMFLILYLIFAWMLPNTTGKMDLIGNMLFFLYRLMSLYFGIQIFAMIRVYPWRLQHIGEYSFFIYCVHMPVISLINLFLARILNSEGTLLLRYGLTAFGTLALVIFLAKILERRFEFLWSILNGGRITNRYLRSKNEF